jgi:hypothetical protein
VTLRRQLVAAAVAAIVIAVPLSWRPAQRYVGTLPPEQFYAPVHDEGFGTALFGVAHNAGNNPRTATRAIAHDAEVVEIDVLSAGGTMVAMRPQPLPWLADRVFQGPTLEEAWRETDRAAAVLIDLKETDRAVLDELVTFLRSHATSRTVMISTRDPGALLHLHGKVDALLLLTLAFPPAVDRLMGDPVLQRAIDGVSAYEGLVDADLVQRLHRRHQLVVAWPVNDPNRLKALADLGVDGVTTDNLAILDLLERKPPRP